VDVRPTQDGGFAVLATTGTAGAGSEDLWLLKLGAAGQLLSDATYGGSQYDNASAMSLGRHGDVFLAGRFQFVAAGSAHAIVLRVVQDGSTGPACDLTSPTAPGTWADGLAVDAVSLQPTRTMVVPLDTSATATVLQRGTFLCSP
jgi:hypothetical protein